MKDDSFQAQAEKIAIFKLKMPKFLRGALPRTPLGLTPQTPVCSQGLHPDRGASLLLPYPQNNRARGSYTVHCGPRFGW